ALGAVVRDPFGALAQRDQREQTPQAVPVDRVEVPRAVAGEEALVGGLDDVLGIDLVAEPPVKAAAGQGDQLAGKALEEFACRGIVPRLEASQEASEGITHGGGDYRPSGSAGRSKPPLNIFCRFLGRPRFSLSETCRTAGEGAI